jgi:hypothetical protein
MFTVSTDWNPKQSLLKELINKKEHFSETISLIKEMHKLVHLSEMSDSSGITYADEVIHGLNEEDYTIMPTNKDVTIAWNIWHITRIEDLTMNLLVHESNQVLNHNWLTKLHIEVRDTGNAMSDDEIIELSNKIDKVTLINYRNAVGKRTREILDTLTYEDLKRKVKKESLDRILLEGGVTTQDDSIWLLDFWGNKTVAGIIQMPITRHQIVHLNDCMKLKKKIKTITTRK